MEHVKIQPAILKHTQVWLSSNAATVTPCVSQRSGKRVSFHSVPDVHFIEAVRKKAPALLVLGDKDDDTEDIAFFAKEESDGKEIAETSVQATEPSFVNSVAV
mmetsp:Transcript_30832/g.57816  ORF Transcript_30832/g.57816 Transcript_30832/m.57816 type:complete len:103 (+) Transcript_30832:54-362(+)